MLRKFAASVALLALAAGTAAAQNAPVKIGVLSDMSSLYADITGEGTGAAARMAAEDAGPVLGQPVQVVAADHQNKADIAAGIVRQWYDNGGVDMVTDGGSSAVALAVEEVSREKHKLVLFNGPASSDITGKHCSPYAAHWNYDTYALAQSPARRSSSPAARIGSSSAPTMPSAMRSSAIPRRWSSDRRQGLGAV